MATHTDSPDVCAVLNYEFCHVYIYWIEDIIVVFDFYVSLIWNV